MYIIHQRTETILREGLKEAVVSCYIFFVSNAALDVFYFEFFFFFGALLSQLKDGLTDPGLPGTQSLLAQLRGQQGTVHGVGSRQACQALSENKR